MAEGTGASPSALGIIPARGGSRGILHKNIVPCGGKPLLCWTLDAAASAKTVDRTILSSDDKEIITTAEEHFVGDLLIRRRPDKHATDTASTESVICDVIDNIIEQPDIIVLLQPTSPVRTGVQIDDAVNLLRASDADSVVSVVRSHHFLWEKEPEALPLALYDVGHRPMRQAMNQFEENGSIYVFRREHFETTGNRLGGKVQLFEMPAECAIQIDTPFDLWLAGMILERQVVNAHREA